MGGTSAGSGSSAGGASAGSSLAGASGAVASAGNSTVGGAAGGAGAPGSAGNAGSAGVSGSAGNAGTGCSAGTYLVCEDFEATAPGQVPAGWTRLGPEDKVGVAEDQAVSGKRSLKLGATENGQRRIGRPGAELGTAHWGRIRFKVQLPVTDAFVHSTLVSGAGMGPSKGALEVRLLDTVKAAKADTPSWCSDKQATNCFQFLYNVQPESAAEFGKAGPYGWSFDESWHCAEWHVDSADQSYEMFYDSKRVDDVSFKNGAGNYDNSDIPSTFSQIRVGWNNYQSASPGFSAWIDDVVLDDQRVGCN